MGVECLAIAARFCYNGGMMEQPATTQGLRYFQPAESGKVQPLPVRQQTVHVGLKQTAYKLFPCKGDPFIVNANTAYEAIQQAGGQALNHMVRLSATNMHLLDNSLLESIIKPDDDWISPITANDPKPQFTVPDGLEALTMRRLHLPKHGAKAVAAASKDSGDADLAAASAEASSSDDAAAVSSATDSESSNAG